MRIMCLPDGLPLDYTIQLANALSKKGEDVEIVLLDNPQSEEHLEDIEKKVNLILTKKVVYPRYHPKNLLIPLDIIRKIRKANPDIIHMQGGDLFSILVLPFLKKHSLVTTFHDVKIHPGSENLVLKFIRFYLKRKSKAIFVHGKKLKKMMVENSNVPEEKVHVIPFGELNVKPFEPYMNENVEENSILFFGWIAPHKGLEYLIKAEPLITKEIPDAKIVIAGRIGNGKYDEKYFRNCQDMIINKDNFEIHPHYISWKFGAELFQKSSIVVLPYIETSQSGVVPVAYNFKKPVVATDVGALSEIVEDGVSGFIVPPEHPNALAEAIIKLLKDKKLREKMGEEGYKKLKTDFSWDKIAEKSLEVYKEVLNKKK